MTVLAQPAIGAGIPLRELVLVLLVACTVTYLVTGVVRSVICLLYTSDAADE